MVVHHSLYVDVPLHHLGPDFKCKDCGSDKVWAAKQQRWWYEIAKGDFETSAVRCWPCRTLRNKARAEQKAHMIELTKKESHPSEAL
ncbi:zinc-ribbon domain containing protein [Microbulbifer okhotskensis]|uniref:zinc-ribbon domain containing protein n=1 Tax=Microbulbifer okhotskensis TaxID=2926617 RepID=UPI00359C329C